MNELKFKWSISTIKIFLENVNPDMAIELIEKKEYLEPLMEGLREEYKKMFLKDEEDSELAKNIL